MKYSKPFGQGVKPEDLKVYKEAYGDITRFAIWISIFLTIFFSPLFYAATLKCII